jgi:Tol biopolymer transport system component
MNDVRGELDREGERLTPSPDAYRSTLDRVRSRERRRRLGAGVVGVMVAAGSAAALWAAIRPDVRPASPQVPKPAPGEIVVGRGAIKPNGPIVFEAHGVTRRLTILRISPDGTGLADLVPDREAHTPNVSPDGSLLAYLPRASSEIRVVGVDGMNDRRLVPEAQVPPDFTSATQVDGWSPDGSRLLFERSNDIYVVDLKTLVVTALTHTPKPIRIMIDNFGVPVARPSMGEEGYAAWSPDGTTIAFVRGGDLYLMKPDGTGARRLVRLGDRMVQAPVWAPDGSALVFSTVQFGGTYPLYCGQHGGGLHIVRVDGSRLRKLTDDACDGQVAWSPGGDRLLFSAGGSVDLMRIDGSGRTTVAPRAESPAWSPDGRRIAFLVDQRWLYVARPDGSGAERIRTPGYTVEQGPVLWAPGRT